MTYQLQVIGVGSPAGDDRLGWELIALLQQRLPYHHRLRLQALDRPGPELIEQLALAEETWLIDALFSAPAGTILHPSATMLAGAEIHSTHGFGVSDSLQLAAALGRLPERLELYAISIAAADPLAEQLSAPVRLAVSQLAQRLAAQIEQRLFPATGG